MTFYFSQLEPGARVLLAFVLFFAALIETAFLIYRFATVRKKGSCAKDIVILAIMIILLSFFTAGSRQSGGQIYNVNVPWMIIPVVSGFILLRTAITLSIERNLIRRKVGRYSVKDAFDRLPGGICFCSAGGGIVLINRRMTEILTSILGYAPERLDQIEEVINGEQGEKKNTAEYRLSDGTVWRLSIVSLSDSGMNGYVQINAENITEIHELTLELSRKSKELEEANEEIHSMYGRLIERMKKQEEADGITKAKTDFESSLTDISNLLETGGDASQSVSAIRDSVRAMAEAATF